MSQRPKERPSPVGRKVVAQKKAIELRKGSESLAVIRQGSRIFVFIIKAQNIFYGYIFIKLFYISPLFHLWHYYNMGMIPLIFGEIYLDILLIKWADLA